MILSGDARLIRMASKSLVSAERSWKLGRIYLDLLENRLRSDFNWLLLCLHQLDIQTERLELADEDVERLGQARRKRRVALDDGFVNLRSAGHIVRLGGEELLE